MNHPLIPALAPAAPPAAPSEPVRIADAARALFLQQGIAAVSVANIAGRLGLDESTVSRWFPNPSALLQAVVDTYAQHLHEAFRRLKQASNSAVEELLAERIWLRQELGQVNAAFFQELEADYPAIWQRWQQLMTDFTLDYIRANLHWGIAQQLYQEHLDVDFLARLWLQQVNSLSLAPVAGLAPIEVYHTQLQHFLSGIVTPAGAQVVRRLQEAPPFY